MAVCDYSSFAKFDLWSSGPEVVEFLQKLCSNDIDMPIGHIRHTGTYNRCIFFYVFWQDLTCYISSKRFYGLCLWAPGSLIKIY